MPCCACMARRWAGQVRTDRVSSYSFSDLQGYLENRKGVPRALIDQDLQTAQWVVFTILDVQPGRPDSLALKNLLSMRPDLLRNKHVIVFCLQCALFPGCDRYLQADRVLRPVQ